MWVPLVAGEQKDRSAPDERLSRPETPLEPAVYAFRFNYSGRVLDAKAAPHSSRTASAPQAAEKAGLTL